MRVKHLIKLLKEQNPEDEVCIFSLKDGNRIPITTKMIDEYCDGSFDINVEYGTLDNI